MKRVCMVTTSPLIVNFFLVPHLLHLKEAYRVSLAVTLPGEVPLKELPGVKIIPVEIRRKISPLHDVISLFRLFRLFRVHQFDLVHSFSPKAGLLAAIAGRLARVPVRVHTFTGQVWATQRGAMRWLLRTADRATARFATHVLADSGSQRDFLLSEKIVPANKIRVLGSGSVAGIDIARFRPDAHIRGAVRRELNIPEQAPVILFLGRVTRDKGVLDLAVAFPAVAQAFPEAMLLVVGPDEDNLRASVESLAHPHADRVRFVDYTAQPERFLAAADILCLPSYREGFGSVIIEAAASGLPAVSTRIYGVTDAVVEGTTGLLYTPGNVDELRSHLERLLGDLDLRLKIGEAARERAVSEIAQARLTNATAEFYEEALAD